MSDPKMIACFLDGEPPNGGGGGSCTNVGFYAYRNANQTISSGLETVILFSNKWATESPAGVFNIGTDTFTAPVEGRYVFSSSVEMTLAARGSCQLRYYFNSVYRGSASDESSIAGTVIPNFAITHYMRVNDTCQMRVWQNSGFAASLIGCCNQLFFSGSLICEV